MDRKALSDPKQRMNRSERSNRIGYRTQVYQTINSLIHHRGVYKLDWPKRENSLSLLI